MKSWQVAVWLNDPQTQRSIGLQFGLANSYPSMARRCGAWRTRTRRGGAARTRATNACDDPNGASKTVFDFKQALSRDA